jgi:hypothetical protein
VVRRSLIAVGASRLAAAEVDPVIRIVEVFGFHLAAMDIRQNSGRHDEAIEELEAIRGAESKIPYRTRPENERRALLEGWLKKTPWTTEEAMAAGPAAAEVIGTYQTLAQHAKSHGIDGLGLSIISMTRDVSDLLAIHVFCRAAGLTRPGEDGSEVCLRWGLFANVDGVRVVLAAAERVFFRQLGNLNPGIVPHRPGVRRKPQQDGAIHEAGAGTHMDACSRRTLADFLVQHEGCVVAKRAGADQFNVQRFGFLGECGLKGA